MGMPAMGTQHVLPRSSDNAAVHERAVTVYACASALSKGNAGPHSYAVPLPADNVALPRDNVALPTGNA